MREGTGLGRAFGFLALVCALSLTEQARANDSTFGGEGADLVPLDETRVSMVSEDIRLEYRADRWYVTAKYVFKNDADAPVSLQVGFPETRCHDDGGDCMGTPFQNLVTKVEGQPVVHRTGKVSKQHEWAKYTSVVWLFDTVFAPHAETRIEHSYSLPSGGDVSMNRFTTYVTRTGANWAGKIGRATFTFKLPPSTHKLDISAAIPLVHLELEDADGAHPYVEAVFERKNWEPHEDVDLQFNSTHFGEPDLGDEPLKRSGLTEADECRNMFEGWTPRQWQACKNLIYAVHGYQFKSAQLQKYFYGASSAFRKVKTEDGWTTYSRGLRAFPQFQTAWIDDEDAGFLRYLDEHRPVEKERAAQDVVAEALPAAPSASTWHPADKRPAASASIGAAQPESSVPRANVEAARPAPAESKHAGCGCDMAANANQRSMATLLVLAVSAALVQRRRSRVLTSTSRS